MNGAAAAGSPALPGSPGRPTRGAPASGGLLRPGHTASVATVPGGRPSPSPALCLWPAGSRVGRLQQGVGRTEAALFLHSTPPFTTRPPFPQLRGGKCREDTESGWPCWSLCGCRALHRGPGGGLRGPELPALSNPGLILGSLGALAAGAECPPTPGTMAFRGLGPDWKLENHGWGRWVGSRRLALCPAPTCSCLRSQLGVSPVPSP